MIKSLIADIYRAFADRPTRRQITEVVRAALPSAAILLGGVVGKVIDVAKLAARIESNLEIPWNSSRWPLAFEKTAWKAVEVAAKWLKSRQGRQAVDAQTIIHHIETKPLSLHLGALTLRLAASHTKIPGMILASKGAFTLLGYRKLGKAFSKGPIVGTGKLAVSAIYTYKLVRPLFDQWAEKLISALMPLP